MHLKKYIYIFCFTDRVVPLATLTPSSNCVGPRSPGGPPRNTISSDGNREPIIFYLKNVLYVPFSVYLQAFVNCSNKITWNLQHFLHLFLHQIIESSMDNGIVKQYIDKQYIDKM